MKRKIFVVLFVAAVVSNVVFAQARQTLKIATIAPARSAWDVSQKRLAQDWAQISGNTITMQFMPATAMGGEEGVIQKLNSVRPGQKAPIDGAIFSGVGIAALAPESHVMTTNVPFMFRSQEEVDAVFEHFNPHFQKAITDKGYVILGWFTVGWAYFYTKTPVNNIKDLKSVNLSVSGTGTDFQALANAFKAAGFTVSDVSADKVLQSTRQAGGVEAIYSIPMYSYAGQFYKTLPYILDMPFCPVMAAFVISERSWNAIPNQYKQALKDAVKEAEKDFINAQKASDAEYLQRCIDGGCKLIKPSAADMRVIEETMNKDAAQMIGTGLMDQKFYDEIKAFLEKYRAGR